MYYSSVAFRLIVSGFLPCTCPPNLMKGVLWRFTQLSPGGGGGWGRGGSETGNAETTGNKSGRLPSAFGVSSLLSPRGGGGGEGGSGPKVVSRVPTVSLVILGPIPNYRPLSLGGVFTPIIAQGQIEVLTPRPGSCYLAKQSERAPRALSPSRGLPSRKAPSRPPPSFRDGCVNSLSSFPCHGGTLVGSPLVWRRGTL
jgi:hypothetical protein